MVGGRVMEVGVGGLTVGGGLSYLSDQYGMVCENVVSFEVVLANSRVVVASQDSNPDLFWALKGGTNNFGIVTKITWPTLPFRDGWGGVQTFALDQMPQVLQALHDYQTAPYKDLHANLIINFGITNDTIISTLIYMDPIMATFVIPPVPRWTWYTNSFKPTPEFYGKLSEILTTAPEVATLKALQGGTLLATFQPINKNLVLEGEKHGGNALGLEPVDQTWLALDVAWWNEADDDVAYDATEALLAKINKEAKADGIFLDYIFINDASNRQPVLASYGPENVQKLRDVKQAYDPAEVFQRLVPGGQKIPCH
ncbi:hypothetical protein DL770_006205 [Monosporascus sp. CRB-9-2]|nr:hypothetical protein DL770_006205 [Monosporascus sp. CRB-9-2]